MKARKHGARTAIGVAAALVAALAFAGFARFSEVPAPAGPRAAGARSMTATRGDAGHGLDSRAPNGPTSVAAQDTAHWNARAAVRPVELADPSGAPLGDPAAARGIAHEALAGSPRWTPSGTRTGDLRARLDAPVTSPGSSSSGLAGRDPGAPRDLSLWQSTPDGPRRLARTQSKPDGLFDFGEWPLPAAGIDLAVLPAGKAPSAGDYERFASPLPAPRATLFRDRADLLLMLRPATASGIALVHEAESGRLLGRADLGGDGAGAASPLRLATPSTPDAILEVVHALPDGRRSAPLRLAQPDPER